MIANIVSRGTVQFAALAISVGLAASGAAIAGERPPVLLVSSSSTFDSACANYYGQGLDSEVSAGIATQFCTCLSAELEGEGLGYDALEFFARTYSEDLTAFISEYPEGEAWMEASFRADKQCKSADYGSNQPPPAAGGLIEAGSWGGVVRSGPGQEFSQLGSLEEGERIMLIENTGVMFNGYPWWKIEFWGSREGYQWGGIICGLGSPIEGTFETCQN
jgi:hypothetical protein